MPENEGVRVDEKDFRQAMRWSRRAPVTRVAPETGSLALPPKKDITQREKARVWFPRNPLACSMGIKSDDESEKTNMTESVYGASAVYREKKTAVHGPAGKVEQPEEMNAPKTRLADAMPEGNSPHDVDNQPHDVEYTVISDEGKALQPGMSDGEALPDDNEAGADDPFAGVIAAVETGIAGMMAEKPSAGAVAADSDDESDELDDGGAVEPELAWLSDEELAEIAGFDLSLLKEDDENREADAPAEDVMASLSEAELAEIAGFDPALLAEVMDEEKDPAEETPVAEVTGQTQAALEDDMPEAQAVPEEAETAAWTKDAGLDETRLQASAFEDAAEAALMEALIADEAAALAQAAQDTKETLAQANIEAEAADAKQETPEAQAVSEEMETVAWAKDAVPDETRLQASAFEDMAEAALMEALIADEAAQREAEAADVGEVFSEAQAAGAEAVSDEVMVAVASDVDVMAAEAAPVEDALSDAAGLEEVEPEDKVDAGFDPAMAEDMLADVLPKASEEAVEAASGEVMIAGASGVGVMEAESADEAGQEAPAEAVFDAEPEVLPEVAEAMAAKEVAAGVDAMAAAGKAARHDAVVEAAAKTLSEAAGLEDAAVSEAEETQLAAVAEMAAAVDETAAEAAFGTEEVVPQAAADVKAKEAFPAEMPDPETALADGIMLAEGTSGPDFDVPPVPVLDEMMAGPEVAIPEEEVFRDKMLSHQRNKMAFAEYKVAVSYAREDTEESRREMVKWYARAAGNGHAVSQFNLGNIYYAGRGVGQDYAVAADWYLLAAGQGVARAQDNLGLMYFHGRGRPVDPEMAVYWFRQAAIQSYAPAQYKLAMHLEAGVGTEPDPEEALHWYKKAAAQGDAKAKKDVARLEGRGQA